MMILVKAAMYLISFFALTWLGNIWCREDDPLDYNELVALGTNPLTGSRIKVVGVFVKATKTGVPRIDDASMKWWTNLATQNGLPPPVLVRPVDVNK